MINIQALMQQVNLLKSRGGDPNQMIQQMLNSGRVTQQQYDRAVQMAQQMFTPNGRRR